MTFNKTELKIIESVLASFLYKKECNLNEKGLLKATQIRFKIIENVMNVQFDKKDIEKVFNEKIKPCHITTPTPKQAKP